MSRAAITRSWTSARLRPCSRKGSHTLSKAVAQGISVGSWNTKPMPPSAASGRSMRPRVGEPRPAISRNAVVLPQPEGPSRLTNSPSPIDSSRASSATVPVA